MSKVFGGGSSESKPQSTLTQTQKQTETALGSYLIPYIGQGLKPYPGQLSATLGKEYGLSEDYLQSVMSGEYSSPEYLEQYFKYGIEDPMMEAWREKILPEIGGEAGRGGFFYGSGRETLERQSAEDIASTLAGERGKLYYSMEQAERARQQEAASLSLQAAMGRTAVEQGILTREQEEWLRTQPEYSHMLNLVLAYLGQDYMQMATSSEGPGFLTSVASGFAQGFGTTL